jgi:hypothetical protein
MTDRRHLVLVASPLPECNLCETPTARDVHERLGGLCSTCDDEIRRLAAGLGSR